MGRGVGAVAVGAVPWRPRPSLWPMWVKVRFAQEACVSVYVCVLVCVNIVVLTMCSVLSERVGKLELGLTSRQHLSLS